MLNYKNDRYAIYNCDCYDMLRNMPDNSVDFQVYSPPFATLYVYSDDLRDLGNCKDYEQFFEQYFETGLINEGIGTIAQEGARNHGLLNISTNDFFNKIVLTIPPSTHEQYKIASTLSSIDKLINNCINKINLMEKNKKGLMQQLFPTSK